MENFNEKRIVSQQDLDGDRTLTEGEEIDEFLGMTEDKTHKETHKEAPGKNKKLNIEVLVDGQ